METSFNNTGTTGTSNKRGSSNPSQASGSVSSSSTSTASNPAQNLGEKVSGQVGDIVNKVKGIDVQEQMDMIKDQYDEVYEASVSAIRANPIAYVAGAAAVGFIAGALWNRK